jgi:hypothetical protein
MDYDQAMKCARQIKGDDYRAAAIEAIILKRVQREMGFSDPGGTLAMRLRREAAAAIAG